MAVPERRVLCVSAALNPERDGSSLLGVSPAPGVFPALHQPLVCSSGCVVTSVEAPEATHVGREKVKSCLSDKAIMKIGRPQEGGALLCKVS